VSLPVSGLFYRVGRWCARHAGIVLLGWLVLLVGVTIGHRALGGVYSDDFTLPGTPASQGANLLRTHHFAAAGGESGEIVFTVGSGTGGSGTGGSGSLARDRDAIDESIAQVRRLPDVLAASDPLATGTVAGNGRIAYSAVYFSVNPQSLGSGYVNDVTQALAPARAAGVAVSYGGQLGQAARPSARDGRSDLIGVVAALIVLIIGFGSVYAAGLPVLSALVGAFAGVGSLGMLAAATTFATVSPTLAIMMGLGVGIDYAVFLTTRHRQLVMDGTDPAEAAARSLSASGPAVLIAALTVVIALLGLYASGLSFIGKLGLAAGMTVAVAACAAFTAVPALLAIAGKSIDRVRIRRPVAEGAAEHAGWQRYAQRVGSRPWLFLAGGVAVLAVLAVPFFSMRLGYVDASADPLSYTDRQAYDAISTGFGPGANGPLIVVVQLRGQPAAATPGRAYLTAELESALARTPDVAKVSPVRATPDGALLVTTVLPRTAPQAAATDQLMHVLQNQTLPRVLSPAGDSGYVTGTLAGQLQFADQVASRLPVIIITVIAAAFLLLLLTFRSPVLAVKAAVLNLFSIAASYGVVVAVFQWGWGSSLFGLDETVPVESYVPMMMFAIVFGLSMDYEVFLLTRVREAWLRSRDNHDAVARGLAATARVISCAALIMASVFFSFLLSDNVVIKMLALGLGVSVLLDASVIRLAVVPSAMFLLGRYNWWTPQWLEAILPAEQVPQPATEAPHPATGARPQPPGDTLPQRPTGARPQRPGDAWPHTRRSPDPAAASPFPLPHRSQGGR
jgi:putative drug exporter of the RND superfamily